MNLQHLEEQIVRQETRALELSLIEYVSAEELAEAWRAVHQLNSNLQSVAGDYAARLRKRMTVLMAELHSHTEFQPAA